MLRLVAAVLAVAVLASCWVGNVDLSGKACDAMHPCEEGYCCVPVGAPNCGDPDVTSLDGGFLCLGEGKQ